ncbi:uncharacterized protein TNCV_2913001 [Trichonephila clavipes]|nr:uncharacterized protein TNCV_2913001 [Trichonephila clavipes]
MNAYYKIFKVSGVSPEIEEMIRKCLSPESKTNGGEALKIDAETRIGMCDPPCSVWCHAGPKLERSDSVLSSSSASAAISLLKDTTDFLLNACNGRISSKKRTGSKLDLPRSKRNFKRSFSANDCDLSYDERCRVDYQIPRFSTSSREDLEFLRRDPINFFKTKGDRNDSWKDNDSGIDSFWSSQEDFYDTNPELKDGYCDLEDIAPMWSLFTGEDSLWKPLPDCALPDHTKFMHKRVSVAFRIQARKSIPAYLLNAVLKVKQLVGVLKAKLLSLPPVMVRTRRNSKVSSMPGVANLYG